MKIVIASDTYYPNINGASYFTYRLATGLAKKGHVVSVIFPSQSSKKTKIIHEGVTVYGIPSFKVPTVKPAFYFSVPTLAKQSVEEIIAEIKPDIIHIQNHVMIGKVIFKIAKKKNIPIVGTNHFMPENLVHYFHLPKKVERDFSAWGWKQFLKVFENLDLVTTPTKTARGLLTKIGFEGEVRIVSCGIDLEKFNPKNDGEYLKKLYKIPTNKPILLYTGRVVKEKKIEQIINAMPQILEKIDAHLVIAGNGNSKPELIELVEKLNIKKNVTFTGFVKDQDLPNLYAIADLFVIAGIAELQSIVTMEALATGLPALGVNAMALPELIHDKENGYLFETGDSNKIARDAVKILTDKKLYDSMSKESLKIIQNHDINKTISTFESIYEEAIGKSIESSRIGKSTKSVKKTKNLNSRLAIFFLVLAAVFSATAVAYAQNSEAIEYKVSSIAHNTASKTKIKYKMAKERIKSKFSYPNN